MISEAFRLAIWRYRTAGGRLYHLAIKHRMTPSTLSATLSGARRVDYDERIIAIGDELGVAADECFEPTDRPAATHPASRPESPEAA